MSKDAKWWWFVATCSLACTLFPIAITFLGMNFGSGRHPNPDDVFWPSLAVDVLFWADFVLTAALIWSMPRWRWLGAALAVPLLIMTGVLAITNGLWIEGTYF